MSIKEKYSVKPIDSYLCKEWCLKKHYAKRIPPIEHAFGLWDNEGMMQGIVTVLKYEIGAEYRYPRGKRRFKLKEVVGIKFIFECGHWCTDCVFMDLINVSTGVQVYKDIQTVLFPRIKVSKK